MSRHINMPSLCREKPLTPFLTFGTWPQEGRSILRWTFERPIATTGSPPFILPRVDAGEESLILRS